MLKIEEKITTGRFNCFFIIRGILIVCALIFVERANTSGSNLRRSLQPLLLKTLNDYNFVIFPL